MSILDRFRSQSLGSSGSASRMFAITPDSGNDIEEVTRGVMVSEAGVLVVDFLDGDMNITTPPLIAGYVYPFRITRVYETSTATGIVGLS